MTGLIYIGKGAHLPNVPARDLSDDDLKRLRAYNISRQALLDSGLYQAEKTNTAPPAAPQRKGAKDHEGDEVKHGIRE